MLIAVQQPSFNPSELSVAVLPPVTVSAQELSTDDLKKFASSTAQEYGLNISRFMATINCESGWNPSAVGDAGTSYGITQIHLPAHPGITESEALDPRWSIEWMAKQWADNNYTAWSCWNDLFGSLASG